MLLLDLPATTEILIEFSYGIIYLVLMGYILRKYQTTGQKLALYFGIAFLFLGISGIYGSLSSLMNALGYGWLPFIGDKILEFYTSLAIASLFFFLAGLLQLK